MTADDPRPPQSISAATFLVASTHDMKNSLGVLTAYLENELARTPGDPATVQALYEAQRMAAHLARVLDLNKLEAGVLPFDPAEIALPDFAAEAAARVRPLAVSLRVTLEISLSPGLHYGYFDHELVLGVIVQALHNAIRYSRDRVRLTIAGEGDGVSMRVDDDGPGFPAFMLDPGFAVRPDAEGLASATGLALYFSSRVADLHRNRGLRGSCRLENGSPLGGGGFVLTLP